MSFEMGKSHVGGNETDWFCRLGFLLHLTPRARRALNCRRARRVQIPHADSRIQDKIDLCHFG